MATKIYKRCPKCNRYYTENNLLFCLTDGTTLTILPNTEQTLERKINSPASSIVSTNKQFAPTQIGYEQVGKTEANATALRDKVVVDLQPTVQAAAQPVKKNDEKKNAAFSNSKDFQTTMFVSNKKSDAVMSDSRTKKSNGKVIVVVSVIALVVLVIGITGVVIAGTSGIKLSSDKAAGLITTKDLGLSVNDVPNAADIEGKNETKSTKTKNGTKTKPDSAEKRNPKTTSSEQQTAGQKTTTSKQKTAGQKQVGQRTKKQTSADADNRTRSTDGSEIPTIRITIRIP